MDNNFKEKIKETLEIAIEAGAEFAGSLLSDALIGQVLPGVTTTYLSYKQKRTEKNLMLAIDLLDQTIKKIENDLKALTSKEILFLKEKVIPITFDCISEEQQEEKIKYFIEGIGTTILNKITEEELIVAYYDILKDLRTADLRILSLEYQKAFADGWAYISDLNKPDQMDKYEAVEKYIVTKLERLNLISRAKTWGELEGDDSRISPEGLKISILGKHLIEFFKVNK